MDINNAFQDAHVQAKFDDYPAAVRVQLLQLRQWVFDCAKEHGLSITESLKWGQPSYASTQGSPVRMDARGDEQFALYFNCNTSLVETIKELHGNAFCYEGKRALVFNTHDDLNEAAIKHALLLALTYKQRRHLPLLGA